MLIEKRFHIQKSEVRHERRRVQAKAVMLKCYHQIFVKLGLIQGFRSDLQASSIHTSCSGF